MILTTTNSKKRKAFSMIEVMCAICIFALAILPLMYLSSNQTKGAYSAGKHMMASQLAASYMDNLLKRSFDDINEKFQNVPKTKVLNSSSDVEMFNLSGTINKLENIEGYRTAEENMKNAFTNFYYEIKKTNVGGNNSQIIQIDIKVYYRVVEGNSKEDYVELHALKFGD